MAIWEFITGLVQPVTDLIDSVHTSDEERLQLKVQIMRIQTEAASKLQAYKKWHCLKPKATSLLPKPRVRVGCSVPGDHWP